MGVWQNSCPQLNANVCRGKLCVLPLSLPVKHYNVESPWARFITVCSAVTYQVLLQLVNPRAMHRLCRYIVLSARPDEYASFSLLDFYARVLPHTRSDTHARARMCTRCHLATTPIRIYTMLFGYQFMSERSNPPRWRYIRHMLSFVL